MTTNTEYGTPIITGTILRFYTSTPFETLDGTPTDPTTVVFGFQVAGGAVQQATYGTPALFGFIVRDGAGLYHIDIDTTDLPGIWKFVFACSGVIQTRSEGQIRVVEPSLSVTL